MLTACGDDDEGGGGAGDPTTAEGSEGTGGTGTGGTGGTGGSGDTVDLTQAGDISIEVVTHGQASDPFWSVFKNGVDAAAEEMGVSANYSAPDTFDMVAMSQLIDAAVAQEPDGLVVSVPDFPALQDSLAAAAEAGIPIITVNSGSDNYQEIGALTHIGQDETIAGRGAGARMAEEGATKVVCINQEVGNAGLDARCNGAQEAIEEAGGTLEVVQVDLNDAAGAQSSIESTLQADPEIDGVLALGPTGAAPALAALQGLNMIGEVQLATFDISTEVIDAIAAGDMSFAIDQQQYLQGYLPIVFLKLNSSNLNTVGGGQPILTGPGFVTAENAEQIKELAAAGTR
ncbi:MAG: sugar ABC transporter substrate-binding protein [Actinomycetota bacterium]|nr:sugar ABC transporter substrate-binding protein [Actinomycetota bacterium]